MSAAHHKRPLCYASVCHVHFLCTLLTTSQLRIYRIVFEATFNSANGETNKLTRFLASSVVRDKAKSLPKSRSLQKLKKKCCGACNVYMFLHSMALDSSNGIIILHHDKLRHFCDECIKCPESPAFTVPIHPIHSSQYSYMQYE